jgi:glucosamine-phosphate N-acetyltransferase
MMLSIRHLTLSDFESNYFHLLSQLSSINANNIDFCLWSQFINNLNNNHQIIVIEDLSNNTIIGTGTIIIEHKIIHDFGKVAHIEDIVIDSNYRGCGLGYKLIAHLKEIAIQKNVYKIILNCSELNTEFYIKCGFKRNCSQMSIYL